MGGRYEHVPCDASLELVNAYGASKVAVTLVAMTFTRENELELAVLRPFHIFGDRKVRSDFGQV